jgi:hypothetical protein
MERRKLRIPLRNSSNGAFSAKNHPLMARYFTARPRAICQYFSNRDPKRLGRRRSEERGHARALRLFELGCVVVRFDHVARFIVNTNHGIM